MTSSLSRVPAAARRRLATVLAGFAVLFLAVGALAVSGGGLAAVLLGAVALLVGVLLGLMAWGVAHSIRLAAAEQRLDQAIEDTLAAAGGSAALCGCGHEHDPSELHVTDADGCAHDGAGAQCAHDCQACVLAGLRSGGSAGTG